MRWLLNCDSMGFSQIFSESFTRKVVEKTFFDAVNWCRTLFLFNL